MTGEFNKALAIALQAISRGDKFAAEVRALLRVKGVEPTTEDAVLDHLEGKRIVDDRRVGEALVASRSGKRALGRSRLEEMLGKRGASDSLIAELLAESGNGDPCEPLRQALWAKFPNGCARARAGRFLYSRGFDETSIEEVLAELFPSEPRGPGDGEIGGA